jgi:hypothetical protein
MKLPSLTFHAFSGLLLLSGVMFNSTPQGDRPAEEVYKDIQMFKGQTVREVDAAMDFMSASLGVQCNFCHVQDEKGEYQFEKDGREEKQTARKMFAMMNQINKDNFDGHLEVTCATCHGGNSHPVSLPPLGPVAQPVRPVRGETLPSVDDLMTKHLQAIGGAAAIDKLNTLEMKGTITGGGWFDKSPVTTLTKAPGKMLVTINVGADMKQGFDGTTAWYQLPGAAAVKNEGGFLEMMEVTSPFFRDFKLKDQFKSFSGVRKDKLNGKDVLAVTGTSVHDKYRERMFFDPASGLLLRRTTIRSTVIGPMQQSYDYSDFRPVSGVMIPFKVVHTKGADVFTLEMSEIKANVAADDGLFKMP